MNNSAAQMPPGNISRLDFYSYLLATKRALALLPSDNDVPCEETTQAREALQRLIDKIKTEQNRRWG